MPLPNTRVIHPRFSTHHQPAAAQTRTATCDITRPATGRGALNKTTGTVTNAPTTVAVDVPCRIQAAASSDRTTQTGDQQVTFRKYLVTIDPALDTRIDDVVTITAAIDTDLIGRQLRVIDVIYGSEIWDRALTCIDTLG